MNVNDQIARVKSELARVRDEIDGAQKTLDDLQARKAQLASDRDDLQAYLDWKAAQKQPGGKP